MSGNPRVIGACVIGFAIVSGAFVLSNFGNPPAQPGTVKVAVSSAPLRTAIAVKDEDGDGLEDWRNSLAIGNPVSLSAVPEVAGAYERPDTLSDDFSVNFFEQIIRSKMYGEFGSSEEEVIQKSIAEATQRASDTLYDQRDIIVISDTDEAIRAYGNRAANIITDNNVPDSRNESVILKNALDRQDEAVLEELIPLSQMYADMRDQYLNTPVPQKLVTQHLNLINSFNAIHNDIEGMRDTFDDPLYSLVRVKRYQDDVTGLTYSLSNLYLRLAETPEVFEPNDSALLFIAFAPINNTN